MSLLWTFLYSSLKITMSLYFCGSHNCLSLVLCWRLSISLVTPDTPSEVQPYRYSCSSVLFLSNISATEIAPLSPSGFPCSHRVSSEGWSLTPSISSHVASSPILQYLRYSSVRLGFLFRTSAVGKEWASGWWIVYVVWQQMCTVVEQYTVLKCILWPVKYWIMHDYPFRSDYSMHGMYNILASIYETYQRVQGCMKLVVEEAISGHNNSLVTDQHLH